MEFFATLAKINVIFRVQKPLQQMQSLGPRRCNIRSAVFFNHEHGSTEAVEQIDKLWSQVGSCNSVANLLSYSGRDQS